MKRTTDTKDQRGDAVVWVLIVIILITAAAVAYWLWRRNAEPISVPKTIAVAVQSCKPADLTLSEGASEGTAGTIYKHAVVTNSSTHNCSIVGFPAVFLDNASGTALGDGAAPSPTLPVTSITLVPGGKAHTVLGLPDAGNFDPSVCSVASTKLQVYIDGATDPVVGDWVDQSCPGFSSTTFQAGA